MFVWALDSNLVFVTSQHTRGQYLVGSCKREVCLQVATWSYCPLHCPDSERKRIAVAYQAKLFHIFGKEQCSSLKTMKLMMEVKR